MAISLIAHTALGLVIIWTMEPDRERVGSKELDIELVAPRLATPLDPAGQEAKDPGRAKRDGDSRAARGSREARAQTSEAHTPGVQQKLARQKELDRHKTLAALEKERAELRDERRPNKKEAARAERELRQRKHRQPRRDGDVKRASVELAEDPAAALARLQRLAFAQQTQLAADTEALPDGPSLNHLVDDVRKDQAWRQARRQHAVAVKQQQRATAERRFAAIAHRTEVLASVSLAGAGTIIGESATTGLLRSGASARQGGKTPRYGLKFYLSGRRVEHSKVVRPPELIKAPRLRCKVTSLAITPATVRMLVEKNGKVGHTYLKHPSGNAAFDRCAVKHARAMQFRPGVDQLGQPLDVWINVRVEPSTLTARAL